MIHLLLIAMAAGLILHDQMPPAQPVPGGWLTVLVLGPMLALMLAATGICRLAGRRLGAASVGRVDRVLMLVRLALAPWFAVQLAGGWLLVVRRWIGNPILLDEFLVLLPALGVLVWTWWCYYPLDRRLREAVVLSRLDRGEAIYPIWSARQFLMAQLRLQVLLVLGPLALIFAWSEAVGRYLPAERAGLAPPLQITGAVIVFLLSPLVIRLILDTAPLPAGEVRDRLTHLCRIHQVRVRDLLLWRTAGGLVNAAVMGVVPPLRYVMMTDGLLDQFPRQQVEAVMAHELAHARLHHLPWLGGFAVVTAAAGDAVMLGLLGPQVNLSWGSGLAVAASAAGWIAAFGWASRRFERQADAFAAAHLAQDKGLSRIDEPSVAMVIATLQRVSDLSCVRTSRRTWRHGSIQSRQQSLRLLIDQPLRNHPIDRAAAAVRRATLLLAAIVVLYHLTA